jgi:hypothetical protein
MARPGSYALRSNALAAWAFRSADLHGLAETSVTTLIPEYEVIAGVISGSLGSVQRISYSRLSITGVINGGLGAVTVISSPGMVSAIASSGRTTIGSIRGI